MTRRTRFRKLHPNEGGYGFVLAKGTDEEIIAELRIEVKDLREAARLTHSIIENIGRHMSMAQHPIREIERAAIEAIGRDRAGEVDGEDERQP